MHVNIGTLCDCFLQLVIASHTDMYGSQLLQMYMMLQV